MYLWNQSGPSLLSLFSCTISQRALAEALTYILSSVSCKYWIFLIWYESVCTAWGAYEAVQPANGWSVSAHASSVVSIDRRPSSEIELSCSKLFVWNKRLTSTGQPGDRPYTMSVQTRWGRARTQTTQIRFSTRRLLFISPCFLSLGSPWDELS